MLGKTAGGLYWMFRYLERSENIARLAEAGFRLSLTRIDEADSIDDWESVAKSAGLQKDLIERHEEFDAARVLDFLLRDRNNPSSVMSVVDAARQNARMVRTALTIEVWEAVNVCWMTLKELLARPVRFAEVPNVLNLIRQQSAQVRGALYGTMLRDDIYNFCRLGTYAERADATARILDVKYYVLLPTVSHVGSSLDNRQWETILQSASAARSYKWLHGGDISASTIADFLILDTRNPRSLAFCCAKLKDNIYYLERQYGLRTRSGELVDLLMQRLEGRGIDSIMDSGLHEFIEAFIRDNSALSLQIEQDFRFKA